MPFSHKHKWVVEEVGEAASFDRIIIQNLMTVEQLNMFRHISIKLYNVIKRYFLCDSMILLQKYAEDSDDSNINRYWSDIRSVLP